MKKKAAWTLIFLLLTIAVFVLFRPHRVYPSDNSEFEQIVGDGWHITGARDSRTTYSAVDGTEDMFFICYSGGYVDAYTNDGEYQYTYVIHSSAQNGGALITCTSDLVYIQYKDSDFFAFRGTELVARMTNSEFRDLGYCVDPTDTIIIAKDGVYKTNENGAPYFLCALPDAVKDMLPLISIPSGVEKVVICVLLGIIFGLFIFMLFIDPHVRKRQKW